MRPVRLFLVCLITVMQVACAVERQCTVNLKESVDVRGFRLGMTLADIKNRFPGFPVVGANSIGVARVEIDGGYHSNRLGIDPAVRTLRV